MGEAKERVLLTKAEMGLGLPSLFKVSLDI